jgi:hypothetical protein
MLSVSILSVIMLVQSEVFWDKIMNLSIVPLGHCTRRNDIQYNNIQHNDTQHYGLNCDTQHERHTQHHNTWYKHHYKCH